MKRLRCYWMSRLYKFLLLSLLAPLEPRGLRMMAKSWVTVLLERVRGYLLCICCLSTVSPHTLSTQGDPTWEDAAEKRWRFIHQVGTLWMCSVTPQCR